MIRRCSKMSDSSNSARIPTNTLWVSIYTNHSFLVILVIESNLCLYLEITVRVRNSFSFETQMAHIDSKLNMGVEVFGNLRTNKRLEACLD